MRGQPQQQIPNNMGGMMPGSNPMELLQMQQMQQMQQMFQNMNAGQKWVKNKINEKRIDNSYWLYM